MDGNIVNFSGQLPKCLIGEEVLISKVIVLIECVIMKFSIKISKLDFLGSVGITFWKLGGLIAF